MRLRPRPKPRKANVLPRLKSALASKIIDDHRCFRRFLYKAGTWPWRRDTIIKVAMTQGKLNPRYVVTNLKEWGGR